MHLIPLPILFVLGLASFRLTRFVVFDSLFENTRRKVQAWLLNQGLIGSKLETLLSCTWCAGIWLSALIYFLYIHDFELSFKTFINVGAIAGLQGFLHALEPAE